MEPQIEFGYVESSIDVLTDVESQNQYQTLIEDLELAGQKKLLDKDGDPMPFRLYEAREVRVHETLFPVVMNLEDYGAEMIPIRVLETIKIARKHFKLGELKVRYSDSKVDEDPIVFAEVTDKDRSWVKTQYFIARWGSALQDLPTLEKEAKRRKKEEWLARAAEAKMQVELFKGSIEANLIKYFNGDYVSTTF